MNLNYDIILCPYSKKVELLKHGFNKTKYMTLNEFKKKYLFEYKQNTLFYLVKKYNMIPENANVIMKNLYFLEDKSLKLNYLINIKNDLITNNYIIYNNNFRRYVSNKKIGSYYNETNETKLLFQNLNVSYIKEKYEMKNINIYELATIDDEVNFVANKIVDLILNGIDINKIKLVVNEELYYPIINKIFRLYNIPFINNDTPLYNFTFVKEILNKIDLKMDISELKDILSNYKHTYKEQLDSILNIFDKNTKLEEIYDIFIYELKNKKIKYNIKNTVEIINIDDALIDNYIFILGFNQDIFPKYYNDDDYLSDEEKKLIGIDTSYSKNIYLKEKIIKIINCNNVFITYKLKTPFNKYLISNIAEEIRCQIIKPQYDYSNLNINKLLLAQRLDNLIKYNIKSNDLDELYSNIKIPYNTYSNKFSKINKAIIEKKIANINLSFSNIDNFYKCQFMFYIENILKIKKNKQSISLEIGNLFHSILENYYKTKKNINEIIDNSLIKNYKNKKEKLYYQKYKKLLLQLVSIIDNQLENTCYENKYFEKWFSIDKDEKLNIKIVGKIDKIMTFDDGENTYVIVIDYKTGMLHTDFNKVIYGMDMQLLIYLYLIKNTNLIKNQIFTGMYLQPILTNVLKNDNNKPYLDLLNKEYKWVGYTISNIFRVKEIDKNYMDNSFIKGLRVKKDETFYSTAKVLSQDILDRLLELVNKNIDFVIESIKKGDFKINPKKIGKNNVSCCYCHYNDICFKTNADLVYLKEYKNLEFLDNNLKS